MKGIIHYSWPSSSITISHCPLFAPQLLDIWETFQFERSQASEFLLSKRHSIVPKLQQLMAAALTELEDLLAKALSGSFMDPSQEQRSTEQQLAALEHQFLNTLNNFNDLRYAYNTFTGTDLHLLVFCPRMNPPAKIRDGTPGPVSSVILSKPWESIPHWSLLQTNIAGQKPYLLYVSGVVLVDLGSS